MEWRNGLNSSTYIKIINPISWNDGNERIEIENGSVSLTDTDLRESASFDTNQFNPETEQWIRIYMDARQEDGSTFHGAVFTGLACSPGYAFNGIIISENVECYSVLKPAKDILLPIGWYASKDSNGAELVKDLLNDSTPAPVIIEGRSPKLSSNIVAEGNESYLSMADKVLDAMNWRFRINGYGEITICPKPTSISSLFDSVTNDVLEMQVNVEKDWFECPNVLRAEFEDNIAIVKDDDPDSMFSIVNRGREIWVEENIELSDFNDLETAAHNKLKELQKVQYALNYTRRYDPEVRPSDLVRVRYPALRIDGIFRVTSQNITLGYNTSVNEKSYLEG